MTDTTLSLAARLAANLFVDAIKLAKPGALAVAKIGDRALNRIGGPAFDERVAQRFLLDGADAINKAEDERAVWEPGELREHPLYREVQEHADEQIRLLNETRLLAGKSAFGLTPHGFNTMPNWQAPQSFAPGRKPCGACDYTDNGWCPCACHEPSVPVAPKPTDVAGSAPGSAPAPPLSGVDPGRLLLVITAAGATDLFNQLVALRHTDVLVQCAHCRRILPKPSLFSVHLLTCDLKIRDPLDVPDSEQPAGVGVAPGTGGTRHGPVGDLADELCDAVLDSYDHAPMVGGSQLALPLRDEFLEGFDWESAARILLTYFSVTRK